MFRSIGITGTSTGFLTTGIFGVVKTVLTFVWILVLIDHLGRRLLLMIGAIGGSLCMWFIGAYIKISGAGSGEEGGSLGSGGIAAMFMFYLWTAYVSSSPPPPFPLSKRSSANILSWFSFYTPSWNGTPWVLNSEMFDQNTRSLGQANAAANNWFWNFIIARFTAQMFNVWGFGVYFFFASLMIISAIFVFLFVPETKGIRLEAMDRLFEIKPTWRAHSLLLAEMQDEEHERGHMQKQMQEKEYGGAATSDEKAMDDHVEAAGTSRV